jgi:hypothetical protein
MRAVSVGAGRQRIHAIGFLKGDIFCAGRVGQMAKSWRVSCRRKAIGGLESGDGLRAGARDCLARHVWPIKNKWSLEWYLDYQYPEVF